MKVKAELTDTFAGEANYSWVRRQELELPENTSDVAVVRAVKKVFGLTGVRFSRRDNYGDMIALWHPNGACQVLFIDFNY